VHDFGSYSILVGNATVEFHGSSSMANLAGMTAQRCRAGGQFAA
jgi:hypothetical protein